ncbi:pitrilysin family protein [Streptomyces sp. NPDC048737]|uniref:M16 family metallopeptidase n=1 Tax=unclassified Streptomyces TaxID=2593676 RepID=UPI003435C6B8
MPTPQRLVLSNGLRVLLDPLPTVPAVAVSVHYDVGFRSEPEGRSGFAHLFEHLMFQGSRRHPKMAHWRFVQGHGGIVNGSTHQDYTEYYQLLPPHCLDSVLAMEADRMVSLRVTEENLDNQRAVVKEEIRLNIHNRAYGGFPWIPLPGLLYRSFANSHNGYGALADLDAATVADAVDFYGSHYSPANAVLAVAGAFDPDEAAGLVKRHFGDLPRVRRPEPAPLDEPPLVRTLHGRHDDPHAPLPALAVGHRLPDPAADLDAYVAHMVLCETLTGGPTSALHARLVRDDQLAVHVAAGCGLFNALDARHPDTLAAVITHHTHVAPETVLAALDAELSRLSDESEVEAHAAVARVRLATRTHRRNADLLARARGVGVYELIHGRPALMDELPDRIGSVTSPAIAAAARSMLTSSRAVLHLIPGSTPAGATRTEVARQDA